MNKPTRFPEEFKIEAVKQITERGHRVAEVSASSMSASTACTRGSNGIARPPEVRAAQDSRSNALRQLKAELKGVTEERDILKKATAYFAKQSG